LSFYFFAWSRFFPDFEIIERYPEFQNHKINRRNFIKIAGFVNPPLPKITPGFSHKDTQRGTKEKNKKK